MLGVYSLSIATKKQDSGQKGLQRAGKNGLGLKASGKGV